MRATKIVKALGQGDGMKDVRDKLNMELVNAQTVSNFANDIEGKAAFVAREARRLNQLDEDTATASAVLVQRRRDFEVEISELEIMRQKLEIAAVHIEKQVSMSGHA